MPLGHAEVGPDLALLSLPCGHAVTLPREAPVLGLSGPILAHQAECSTVPGQPGVPGSSTADADSLAPRGGDRGPFWKHLPPERVSGAGASE